MRREFRVPRALSIAIGLLVAIGSGANLIAGQLAAADANALEVIQIRPNFYVIGGDGSNIAVQFGTDGVVVVDTGTGATRPSR